MRLLAAQGRSGRGAHGKGPNLGGVTTATTLSALPVEHGKPTRGCCTATSSRSWATSRSAKLTPSAVRGWHARLAGRHSSTAAKAYRLLRTMMNTAVADELVVRNPCRVEGAGQERSAERPIAGSPDVFVGGYDRPGSSGQRPPRVSMAMAMSASGLWNP